MPQYIRNSMIGQYALKIIVETRAFPAVLQKLGLKSPLSPHLKNRVIGCSRKSASTNIKINAVLKNWQQKVTEVMRSSCSVSVLQPIQVTAMMTTVRKMQLKPVSTYEIELDKALDFTDNFKYSQQISVSSTLRSIVASNPKASSCCVQQHQRHPLDF